MLKLNAENAPQTVIFEGDMTDAKAQHLRHLARDILFQNRRDASDTLALTSILVNEGRHPDLVEFLGESILIGPERDAPPGTVRHLLRKILPYAPWKSNARVILFQDAAGIKNEAETALLKTLEEPKPKHYFFLNAQTADLLKETIRSRAVITRFVEPSTGEGLPADPWKRFYYLIGKRTLQEHELAIIDVLRNAFDQLTYSVDDFSLLENAFFFTPKKLLEKETLLKQNRALNFAINPVYAALRDSLTEGKVSPLAPFALTRIPTANALEAAKLIQEYMRLLDERVFGNRPLNQSAIFYSFFFRFMPLWAP
ncbi:MAG: hypothetical protein LDLANPLL_02501 [Turneriella sp.]|nr:hypothetical protein [Turneriella sp.]